MDSLSAPDSRRLLEAEGYLELELPDLALEALSQVSAEAADSAAATGLRAECFRQKARYDEAIPLYQEALKLSGDPEALSVGLGWCYRRAGDLDKAIESLSELLKAEPRSTIACYNLACYYSLAGRKDECLRHLDRALEMDPDYARLIDREPDFDPVRKDPEFLALVRAKDGDVP